MASRSDGRPIQPLDGDVLADGAGYDGVSLGTELVNRLNGVEADGPLRSAVVPQVAMCVALEPQGGHPCRGYRRLWDAARRDADLYDSPVHSRPPWRAGLASFDCTRAAPRESRVRGIRLISPRGGSFAGPVPPAPARRAGSGRGGGTSRCPGPPSWSRACRRLPPAR